MAPNTQKMEENKQVTNAGNKKKQKKEYGYSEK